MDLDLAEVARLRGSIAPPAPDARVARDRPRATRRRRSSRAQIVVREGRVLALQIGEPVEVEVGDGQAAGAGVALPDREGRRGDRLLDPEGPAGSSDQRRLAGADLAGDEDQVPGLEAARDPGSERFGLGRAERDKCRRLALAGRLSRRGPAGRRGRRRRPRRPVARPRLGDLLGARQRRRGAAREQRRAGVAKSARSVSFTAGVRSAAAGWKSGRGRRRGRRARAPAASRAPW